MKIVFNRQNLSEAISPLMCAVSGKSTMPSVEGILIEAVFKKSPFCLTLIITTPLMPCPEASSRLSSLL